MRAALVILLVASTAAAKPRVRIDVWSDPILVQKERQELAAAVGAFVAKNGFELVPAADLEKLARVAREGRNFKTDEVCGVAVAPHRVFENVLPDVKTAVASVTCDKACSLVVDIQDVKHWQVALPAKPTPAQILAAVKRLKPAKSPEVFGGVMGGSLGSHVGVIFVFEQSGPWTTKPDDAIESHQAALDKCTTEIRRTNISNTIVLDIDAAGAVATCESQEPLELPVGGFDCLCAELVKVDFGKSTGARRLRADVFHQTADVVHGNGKVTNAWVDQPRSTDPTAMFVSPGVSSHALASCIPADLAVPKTWSSIPVTWHVDAHGKATKTTVEIPGAPAAVKRCFDTALATATFSCPQAGGDVDVTGVLTISVH